MFKLCSNSFGKDILTVTFQNSPKRCLYATWNINSFGCALDWTGIDVLGSRFVGLEEESNVLHTFVFGQFGTRRSSSQHTNPECLLVSSSISVVFGLLTSVMMKLLWLTVLTELTCTVATLCSNYRPLLRKLCKSQRVEAEQPEDIRGGQKQNIFFSVKFDPDSPKSLTVGTGGLDRCFQQTVWVII